MLQMLETPPKTCNTNCTRIGGISAQSGSRPRLSRGIHAHNRLRNPLNRGLSALQVTADSLSVANVASRMTRACIFSLPLSSQMHVDAPDTREATFATSDAGECEG